MRGIWYGDRRDRLKWGGLVHLARKYGIKSIVQVAYLRWDTPVSISSGTEESQIDELVWDHFSDVRQVERLGERLGIAIRVIDRTFEANKRAEYVQHAIAEIERSSGPRIVALDPDTGIAPSRPKPEHVSVTDLVAFWEALERGDILVVYQHAWRSKDWLEKAKSRLAEVCLGAAIEAIVGAEIASDAALLWSRKSRSNIGSRLGIAAEF